MAAAVYFLAVFKSLKRFPLTLYLGKRLITLINRTLFRTGLNFIYSNILSDISIAITKQQCFCFSERNCISRVENDRKLARAVLRCGYEYSNKALTEKD